MKGYATFLIDYISIILVSTTGLYFIFEDDVQTVSVAIASVGTLFSAWERLESIAAAAAVVLIVVGASTIVVFGKNMSGSCLEVTGVWALLTVSNHIRVVSENNI